MAEQIYLRRRAAQETSLALLARNRKAAAAHDVMAAAYFKKLAKLADIEESLLRLQRPAQL